MHVADRMSVAQFRSQGAKRNKYSAKAIIVNGQRFDSRLESERYLYWNNLWQVKGILWFIRQAPFRLPGNIIYRADFLVVHPRAGRDRGCAITVEDCKGYLTRVSLNKIKQVEEIYGITVDLITRKDMG